MKRIAFLTGPTGFCKRYGFHRIDELTTYGGDVNGVFARDI